MSRFLTDAGANIVHSDQHTTDPRGGAFFMRMEFELELTAASAPSSSGASPETSPRRCEMEWQLADAAVRKRVAILVSRADHCLLELLWRQRRGELQATFPLVASNHPDLREDVGGLRRALRARAGGARQAKAAAEERLLELLVERVDLVVLARYMQILSGEFLERLAVPVINIHHSFLPSFVGADPYQQARRRGREADRRHRPLRHRGARRRADHRAGRARA